MLECVVNVSEGQQPDVLDALRDAAGPDLLDVHVDGHHHRSVFTLVGEEAPRRLAQRAVEVIDLGAHHGVHPRIGAVDVVPFVPLDGTPFDAALAARDRFAAWAGDALRLPCFLYGPERTLPAIRRGAFDDLAPDHGPSRPHPTAGGCAVGARPLLVAYNLWLRAPDLVRARQIAAALRGPAVRALGLQVGDEVQVSMNLIAPDEVGPAQVWDAVASSAPIARAELVGLVPRSVLGRIDRGRWIDLDLAEERTIEARLSARGVGEGR